MAVDNRRGQQEDSEFEDKVIHINRCAKVVKGGRRFSFSAIVVVGDKKGQVGVGLGKAGEVPEAIKKAGKQAKKNLMRVPMDGKTIPHEIIGRFGASQVLMKPAPEGTGIIASSSVRAIMEVAGIQNILTKSIRRDNPHNVVRATLAGLKNLRNFADIAKARGKTVGEIL
ncbi:MAG TPA: 30S ribosomal protein S5 [Bdellovibrionales bacterium]|nr:MAG: 30S ribosomal protein S5 [Bdellovibrionales bacterium GWB1_52_6]OFZ02614.1 MAG: 30S ribosomal protein S5 [Bdellovibrionales bacterium GWA1_52_35]OFZ41807.1 MAG: 30S ribosomal protein S5 [Bdellovibrionales bacterium GWC1_52_8]HAR43852.1 30S ribosomal protein S5 [Bdellovibrionales bacterium]HCM41471.1 30S ribosomal protein S5 [Bdellovibrionales bacterium]